MTKDADPDFAHRTRTNVRPVGGWPIGIQPAEVQLIPEVRPAGSQIKPPRTYTETDANPTEDPH